MSECEHGFSNGYGCPSCVLSEFMVSLENAAKRGHEVGILEGEGFNSHSWSYSEVISGQQEAGPLYKALVAQQERIKELETEIELASLDGPL